jgi:hypothetical protein
MSSIPKLVLLGASAIDVINGTSQHTAMILMFLLVILITEDAFSR